MAPSGTGKPAAAAGAAAASSSSAAAAMAADDTESENEGNFQQEMMEDVREAENVPDDAELSDDGAWGLCAGVRGRPFTHKADEVGPQYIQDRTERRRRGRREPAQGRPRTHGAHREGVCRAEGPVRERHQHIRRLHYPTLAKSPRPRC